MDSINKEHVISGIIGGITTLALAGLVTKVCPKVFSRCCSKATQDGSFKAGITTMVSQRAPAAIGPYSVGKKILLTGGMLAYSSGQLGMDP